MEERILSALLEHSPQTLPQLQEQFGEVLPAIRALLTSGRVVGDNLPAPDGGYIPQFWHPTRFPAR